MTRSVPESTKRVAAIDCGTNSIRLLVVDLDQVGGLHEITRQMRIVRLGQDVDRTGRLAPEALHRTDVALADYAALIETAGVAAVRLVATSAVRDVENREVFHAMVQHRLGVAPDVVDGREEAQLSFTGAAHGMSGQDGLMLVVDLGGGSTELILGEPARQSVQGTHSMDVGSVRLTERHLTRGAEQAPTAAEITAIEADVQTALRAAEADVDLDSGALLVGVAGTVTTIAAMALGLAAYDSACIHGARIPIGLLEQTIEGLLAMTRTQRAGIAVLHPGRVDVIDAGAVILRCLVRRTSAPVLAVSESDILDGIALSMGAAGSGPDWR